MHPRLPVLALLSGLLVLSGCQHGGVQHSVATGTEVQPSLDATTADDNLNAVLWMQSSVEFRATATLTYRAAVNQLDAALADPQWDALVPAERSNPATGLKPAVILDIDETVLDNSPYPALLEQYDDHFGERWWMLANLTYGDWLPALFDNDRSLPPTGQHEAKRAGLDAAGAIPDPGYD